MREFLLYGFALPLTLWWAYRGFSAALAVVRADAKEAAALALGRKHAGFARAYSTVRKIDGSIPACAPWHRPECGGQPWK